MDFDDIVTVKNFFWISQLHLKVINETKKKKKK